MPLYALLPLAVLYAAFLVLLWVRGKKTIWLRAIIMAFFFVVLLNPVSITETRKAEKNLVLVVLDETQSQSIAPRGDQMQQAFTALSNSIQQNDKLQMQTIRVTHQFSDQSSQDAFQETHLYTALKDALSNMDKSRLAGVVIITDGQIHDLPALLNDPQTPFNVRADLSLPPSIPIHALITGTEDEVDRQIIVENTPFYGITGQEAAIDIYIQTSNDDMMRTPLPVTLTINGQNSRTEIITPNETKRLMVPIEQAGHNVYELSIPVDPRELSRENNRKVVTINGVRDRLQVLLISGTPNHGGRMWRDLLRSDASVDLVHFTILREPGKIDSTPTEEMSLIEFPIRELFETKINNFDLIIFDRYGLTYLLPSRYFDNIHDFVANGGALFMAVGPESLSDFSIFDTRLGDFIPAQPTGDLIEQRYTPALTRLGRRHPVTSFMNDFERNPNQDDVEQTAFALDTAPWFRQVAVTPKPNAQVLMSGANDNPLLLLDRYQEGRVALLTSDQLWLWARGFGASGPDRAFLKRTIHWLMKEPDLEEDGLQARVQGSQIKLIKRALREEDIIVQMRKPDGTSEDITLKPEQGKAAETTINAGTAGIYTFTHEAQKVFAVVGDLNTAEQTDLLSTLNEIEPLVTITNGYIVRLDNNNTPDIRLRDHSTNSMSSRENRLSVFGNNWMGFLDRKAYSVAGTKETPFIPLMPAFLILFLGIIAAWIWESRTRRFNNTDT